MRHTSNRQTHRARRSRSAVVGGVLLLAAVLAGCGDDDRYIRIYGDDYPYRTYTTGTTSYSDGVVYDSKIYHGTYYGSSYYRPKVVVVDPPRRGRALKKHHHRYDRKPHFDKRHVRGVKYGLRRPSKHHPPLLPPPGESFRDGEWEWDDGRWEWDD